MLSVPAGPAPVRPPAQLRAAIGARGNRACHRPSLRRDEGGGMTAHALPGTPLSLLNTQPNIPAPDDFYQELVDMHRDLSAQQSALGNGKLILVLANHVGDLAVLREAMRAARQDIAPPAQAGGAREAELG